MIQKTNKTIKKYKIALLSVLFIVILMTLKLRTNLIDFCQSNKNELAIHTMKLIQNRTNNNSSKVSIHTYNGDNYIFELSQNHTISYSYRCSEKNMSYTKNGLSNKLHDRGLSSFGGLQKESEQHIKIVATNFKNHIWKLKMNRQSEQGFLIALNQSLHVD